MVVSENSQLEETVAKTDSEIFFLKLCYVVIQKEKVNREWKGNCNLLKFLGGNHYSRT